MTWSQKRRTAYLFGFVFILGLILVGLYFLLLSKAPTCNDGVQNQNELGVDCGGICETQSICVEDVLPLNVVWTKVSLVQASTGVYNAIAYIKNPNVFASAKDIPYSFKIYDADSVLIYKRDGVFSVMGGRNQTTAVFEAGLKMVNSIPAKVVFEIEGKINWYKTAEETLQVKVDKIEVLNASTSPKIAVTIKNDLITNSPSYEAIGVAYDSDGNAVDFSSTIIDPIAPNSENTVFFTWLRPFDREVVSSEVILKKIK
ncbi:MAG: hypothetical protein WCF94_04020 [bacterium]